MSSFSLKEPNFITHDSITFIATFFEPEVVTNYKSIYTYTYINVAWVQVYFNTYLI